MDGIENLVVELAAQVRERFYGKYRGVVSDVDDPERMGRIKARVPEVLADTETPWALPCTPYPGMGAGWYAIPPVGAGVWVEFEAGDPSRPVWTGGWFGRSDAPSDETGKTAQPPTEWIRKELGPDTPLHFSRFYPLSKLKTLPPTPVSTLEKAREAAASAGLEYVYVGNIPGHTAENTFCPKCKKMVIQRTGYMVGEINLKDGKCKYCGKPIPGIWT